MKRPCAPGDHVLDFYVGEGGPLGACRICGMRFNGSAEMRAALGLQPVPFWRPRPELGVDVVVRHDSCSAPDCVLCRKVDAVRVDALLAREGIAVRAGDPR